MNRIAWLLPTLGWLLLGALSVAPDHALAQILVRADGTGDYPTIQAALDAAEPGDIVELEDGIYRGTGNRDLRFRGKDVILRSRSGVRELCILDLSKGQDADELGVRRGFCFCEGEGPGAVLASVTIRNGYVVDGGAGIRVENSAPTIKDCLIENSRSEQNGGGVYCASGAAPTFDGCRLTENTAWDKGAAVFVESGAEATIRGSEIDRSRLAEAVFVEDGAALRVAESAFRGNASIIGYGLDLRSSRFSGAYDSHGGGVAVGVRSGRVEGCEFTNNSTGLHVSGEDVVTESCWFYDNETAYFGVPTLAELSQCVFTDNDTGIFLWDDAGLRASNVTLTGNGIGVRFRNGCRVDFEKSILRGNCFTDLWWGPGSTSSFSCSAIDPDNWTEEGTAEFFGEQILEDPQFCGEPCGDERFADGVALATSSPCLAPRSPCGERVGATSAVCLPAKGLRLTGARVDVGVLDFQWTGPVPAREQISFRLGTGASGVPSGTSTRARIVQASGRLQVERELPWKPSGEYRLDLIDGDGRPLGAGVYFLVVSAGDHRATRRFAVVR